MDIAYVLHRRRYRETSLIVDFLSLERGRVSAVARGALRPRSQLGSALQETARLRVAFSGRAELLTLRTAEHEAPPLHLEGAALYSLFYLNELVVRLTASHDQNTALFEAYVAALGALAAGETLEALLRRFEKRLLDAIGLGLNLHTVADTGETIDPEIEYRYLPDQGAMYHGPAGAPRVHGRTLIALANDDVLSPVELAEAKTLMRVVLAHHLEGRPLAARELFRAPRG